LFYALTELEISSEQTTRTLSSSIQFLSAVNKSRSPFIGSARESGIVSISRGFLERDEFGSRGGRSLRFQEQVFNVPVASSAAQQSLDVVVNYLDHAHQHFGPTVVEDPLHVIEQHISQLLHRLKALPAQLIDSSSGSNINPS
jgi:hypothetical protein